ncbi:ribbon-helix-helix protein, CopG family [Jannaschia pohangensis]|uniref:ribbon-helix-helix protein, CopG family n=1 Tax=Jannaschia pohangensis TaxID=390807 RepID=UPI001113F965
MCFLVQKTPREAAVGRPRTDRKIARISVSLDDQDYQVLREIADKNDVSAAWIVRRAVSEFLDRKSADQNEVWPEKVAGR